MAAFDFSPAFSKKWGRVLPSGVDDAVASPDSAFDTPDARDFSRTVTPGLQSAYKEIKSSAVLPSVTAVNPDHPSMDMSRSRSNGAYIPQGQGPDYTSELHNLTSQLEEAYSKPQAGIGRQILGALISNRNPALGAVVSGQAARDRSIEPLMNRYKLVSSALQANDKQKSEDLNRQNVLSEIQGRSDLSKFHEGILNTKESPVKTPEQQTFDKMVSQGVPEEQAFERVKNVVDKSANAKTSEEDKAISDYISGHKMQDTPVNRDRVRSILKTRDRPPKDPEVADIGKKIKQAQLEKMKEATPDEQRRDDLAQNLEENLKNLERIARNRPELFGPIQGRITGAKQAFGTSDPDAAALKVIEEQTGLAMVGAHAMRNAQHAEKAAQSITGANHTPASALLAPNGPIAAARASLKTFKADAQRRRNAIDKATGDENAAPETSGEGGVQIIRDANGRIIGVK